MNWLLSILYWCIPSARSLGIVALIFSVAGALLWGATALFGGGMEDGFLVFLIASIPAVVDGILLYKRKDR